MAASTYLQSRPDLTRAATSPGSAPRATCAGPHRNVVSSTLTTPRRSRCRPAAVRYSATRARGSNTPRSPTRLPTSRLPHAGDIPAHRAPLPSPPRPATAHGRSRRRSVRPPHTAIDLTPTPAPQADGIGGPIEVDRREQPGRPVRSPLPRQRRLGRRRDSCASASRRATTKFRGTSSNIRRRLRLLGEPPLLRRDAARSHMAGAVRPGPMSPTSLSCRSTPARKPTSIFTPSTTTTGGSAGSSSGIEQDTRQPDRHQDVGGRMARYATGGGPSVSGH